ncbi:hypothetical protein [Streptomyces sp. NBC_00687]|nr:hypothetical protein [Streptomyces sp. NBC_00687]MCX4919876.1 hypothetical protein [Streptomyces sp. NBC_00687]
MAIAALAALGAPAAAGPMPWDSHKAPVAQVAAAGSGTVSVLCVGGCYQ